MSDGRQLPLAFAHEPAMAGSDFLVAASNADAVAWLRRWPDWPTPVLLLHGPTGCGKSHLARAFSQGSGAARLAGDDLVGGDPLSVFEQAPAAVLDDADLCVRASGGEPALLHLVNAAAQTQRKLLLTAHQPSARWPLALPDLASRLNAACTVGIDEPDEALMRAVMGKLFVDRQLRVGDDVLGYLLARMERSLAAAGRLVEKIDAAALARRQAVTIPLARAVLAECDAMPSPPRAASRAP